MIIAKITNIRYEWRSSITGDKIVHTLKVITVKNEKNGRAVSIVQHPDGTINVRNISCFEIYDGPYNENAKIIILIALFGREFISWVISRVLVTP